ncbi:MAG: nitrate reductase subunit alpha [Thiohalospira sp.]
MGDFLDRLRFFSKNGEEFAGGWGKVSDEDRAWEDTYRNRFQHDKVVRTTHGVNCTGSCSWKVFVKNGLITWEMQQTDYPRTRPDLPNHEPRGCQRGASFSWYEYSPHRIKYPLVRGRLVEMYRRERQTKDPVEAWAAIVEEPEKARAYKGVRGLGGFVRTSWDEAQEMIAAANVYTAKTHGPDRINGFSPIPAMSMLSYAAGSRYLSLIGGNCLSFYDWYCDLPPASPQTWGEQTDVPEAADWYNSTYLIVTGANLPMTRTPDAHFYAEARYKGTKVVSMAPDYAEYVKFADLWMPVKQGTDAAAFLAMGHVALKEFHLDRQDPYFHDYVKRYTDMPMVVRLEEDGGTYRPGRLLRASDFDGSLGEDNNPEWKTIVFDQAAGEFAAPNGSIGFRWGEDGKWNLEQKAGGREIDAALSFIDGSDDVVPVAFPHFAEDEPEELARNVPVRTLEIDGEQVRVATVFDLQAAQYGVDRGLGGDNVASSYDDSEVAYTPAWAEKVTGVKKADLIRTGREFADNAAKTHGKSMVILGAAINHWYHNDMNYRAIMNLLHLCGCVGQSGGGWAHYVGQEKLRPQAGWAPIAFGLDWHRPPRHMNGTTFYYFHTDQWRYETIDPAALKVPGARDKDGGYQLADYNVVAQRLGWLPSAPHFNENPLEIVRKAEADGATTEEAVAEHVVGRLKSGDLRFASEDVDNPTNFPRNLFVWRSNLLGCSAKGHEYFLKHLLGTQNGVMNEADAPAGRPEEIEWHEEAPTGKLDLLVDINFRMNSTGLHSDIVLPTATWYEKNDLNTSDMHPFIHPLSEVVNPLWESKSDWDIFKGLAAKFGELAGDHLGTQKDLVAMPMQHDTAAEIAQPFEVQDWKKGECEPIPGKTLPVLKVVERDFASTGHKFISLGPLMEKAGNAVKGVTWETGQEIEELRHHIGTVESEGVGKGQPSLESDIQAADALMSMAPETNGEVAYRTWSLLSKKTGRDHTHLAADRRGDKMHFRDLQSQPRKIITAHTWSGLESEEVSYTQGYTNIHELIPFRTLTGRAQFYQDHEWMRDFGEAFCAYRPAVDMRSIQRRSAGNRDNPNPGVVLNWITPHSKWGIHSTYNDNHRMLTLGRGGPIVWISEVDAEKAGIADNDWVEAANGNGATMARAVVSQRIPEGMAMMYHAQEKNVNVPGSRSTGKRGGILNSVTRVTVKPTHMIGGYAHLSYFFNYYGTVGSQRDEFVVVRRVDEVDWLERPLTEEREKAPDVPGL